MGYEEKIYFKIEAPEELHKALINIDSFTMYDEASHLYNFHLSDNSDSKSWPDVTVAIEKDGIYFSDNKIRNVEILSIAKKYCSVAYYEEL